jgi:hypothetical protein
MATASDGAAAVQALRQNAQQAGANAAASAGAGQQIGVPGVGEGQLWAAAGSPGGAEVPPTMQESFHQQFTQPLIDQNVRAMRPDYGDPNEWSYAGDAMALAFKEAQPGENAIDNLLGNFGDYGSRAAAQRNAVATGDYGAIQAYQTSGDPLLDIVIDWDMNQGYNWAAGGGASGGGVGGAGSAGGDGGGGDGGV